MKNLVPILLIFFIVSCKKEEINPDLTRQFSIQSDKANATYAIKVALPENYDPAQKYATLYVLDGEENFNFVTENVKTTEANYSGAGVIVIGIGYGNNRTMDYTPTKAEQGEGGAENFMSFIKDELIPRIENDFAADTARKSRIILGHSFGGLFAAYAFTNFNDVFGNYIMLSPSIWYDNEIMLHFEQENRNENSRNHQLVFMGLGELESGGRMLAPYMSFYQRLQNNYPDAKISSHIEPHLSHVGSKNPNIREAIRFYFQKR